MAEDALQAVKLRNDFYRDGYRKVILSLLIAMILLAAMAATFMYMVTHPPAPKYFATTVQGRIVPLIPLDQPNTSTSALLQWANTAAIAAYTYNFVNYRQELQAAAEFFTPDGWRSFLDALKGSRNLEAVIDKKLIVSAVATGAPIVAWEGLLNDQYSWRVQMPMLITYQSASNFSQQSVTVNMLITRISTLNSARGIGIAQFVVTPGGGR